MNLEVDNYREDFNDLLEENQKLRGRNVDLEYDNKKLKLALLKTCNDATYMSKLLSKMGNCNFEADFISHYRDLLK